MWFSCTKFNGSARLVGKTAIITGGNTGIGKETAKEFYKRGARVIIACRSLERANEAADDIKKECESLENVGVIIVKILDLNNLSLVRQSATSILETEQRIDLLINNAGIMGAPNRRTDDGFETHFGVNHLGHFLFTLMLLPRIIASAPARIVNVSSVAHEGGSINFDDLHSDRGPFNQLRSYAQSKLANIMFAQELARRMEIKGINGVTTYSLHPGVIRTELGRNFNLIFPGLKWIWNVGASLVTKTPEQGAQTTLHCALDEQAGNETGLYYSECKKTKTKAFVRNEEVAKKLWDVSINLTGLENNDPLKLN